LDSDSPEAREGKERGAVLEEEEQQGLVQVPPGEAIEPATTTAPEAGHNVEEEQTEAGSSTTHDSTSGTGQALDDIRQDEDKLNSLLLRGSSTSTREKIPRREDAEEVASDDNDHDMEDHVKKEVAAAASAGDLAHPHQEQNYIEDIIDQHALAEVEGHASVEEMVVDEDKTDHDHKDHVADKQTVTEEHQKKR
ncbi:unnamed protein product, partial [Amoebophrya sp. A25]